MNYVYYLKRVIDDNSIMEPIIEKDLYENVANELLKEFFSLAHHEVNRLLKYLNARVKNGHYNAMESRELIKWIEIIEKVSFASKNTDMAFSLNHEYLKVFGECKEFLVESGGSTIPQNYIKFNLIEHEAIFHISNAINVIRSESKNKFVLKQIGEGSYAKVFKYKDDYYNKYFVLKRANKDLSDKEVERFKREFVIMKKLKSPYIIDVYRYDNVNNEYIMEYTDETLKEYISKNNNKLTLNTRGSIANQILRGFEYIHSKGYLHRDISFTNILLQHYDGISIVKISDFGLVKTKTSTLTSFGTEFKGSLNDGALEIIGFEKYNILHETYALTRLIYYVMTGKENLERTNEPKIKDFVTTGTHAENDKRYKNIGELINAYKSAFGLEKNKML